MPEYVRIEYTRYIIENVLKNFPELYTMSRHGNIGDGTSTQLITIMLCDIEKAGAQVPKDLHPYITSLFVAGDGALVGEPYAACSGQDFENICNEMYEVLNIIGLD